MKQIICTLGFCLLVFSSWTQKHHERFQKIDIQHYVFDVHLNDTSNIVSGKTTVKVKRLQNVKQIKLDLVGADGNKGMLVSNVKSNGKTLTFRQENDQLVISLDKNSQLNKIVALEIYYSGIPSDGLIISKNSFEERTFFGDNWPDRAKHWLPSVDHPSDKATVEFRIFAPEHYEVVSNGYLVEKKQMDGNMEFTHWKEDIPISTKLMVIGVADFAVGNKESYNEIPVSSWVFKQNKEKGLKNYKYGVKALRYFSELIGPYPYEKLAHVQSKTRYGGMENASCIFYHEKTATSERSQERLFAHEVAHQWFGNSVTEQNWHHVWLSEGFATYLTHVYNQHFHGNEVFLEGLKNDRERIIRYSKQHLAPIIDTTITEYIRLLNTNSYQKASWFLHMLRINSGDQIFFEGLRQYYETYRDSTALSNDFLNIMEKVTGKDLDLFFEQWLRRAGHPVLQWNWVQTKEQVQLNLEQVQNHFTFCFPLEIEIYYENGDTELINSNVSEKHQQITTQINSRVKKIVLDPKVKLLFETKKAD